MNILMIDDEYYARKAVIKLLETLFQKEHIPIHIYEFSSAEKTISFLKETNPAIDAAFTDIRMDNVDGLNLCEYLRKYNPDISLVIISGYEEFSYAQRAMKNQVLAYLTKPVDSDEIRDVILKIIHLHSTVNTPIPDTAVHEASTSKDTLPHTAAASLIDSFNQKLISYYLSQQKPEQLCEVAENYFSQLLIQAPDPQTCSLLFLQELVQICRNSLPVAIQRELPKTLELLRHSDDPGSIKKIVSDWLSRLCGEIHAQKRHSQTLAERAFKYMEENYSYDIRLETIATQLYYVHPNYLSKVLKKRYGKSFSKLLLEVRMKNALRYLQRGNLNVSTVAQFVGYNSESHFVQIFKKYYGYTPGNVSTSSSGSSPTHHI